MAVVIPCWNDGAFLAEAIASVHAQDEPAELVVVDDGSTDTATLEELDRLRGEGIRVVRRENGGVGAARMTGVAETSAPYVFPLDSDDRIAPGALRPLADALDARPGAAAAWGDTRAFGAINWIFPTWRALDPWLITYMNRVPVGCLYRRAALKDVGGWTLTEGYEDWDMWLALASQGWTGTHIGRVHLEYRQHDTPRMLARERDRHTQTMRSYRERHPSIFAARRQTARESLVPLRVRFAFRLIDRIPSIDEARRHRLHDIALRALVPETRPITDAGRDPGPLQVLVRRLTRRG
ncbi:MAG: glycosyltransferase family A protein [Thermoleophilia bacterium]